MELTSWGDMGRINKFEDIDAWQKARVLTRRIYVMTDDGAFAKDYSLRDQIRRAAVSIMSNVAEGFDRGGAREYLRFLFIARGSVAEVQSHLYVALDAKYIIQEQFEELYDLAGDTGRVIGGVIRYLKRFDEAGTKR